LHGANGGRKTGFSTGYVSPQRCAFEEIIIAVFLADDIAYLLKYGLLFLPEVEWTWLNLGGIQSFFGVEFLTHLCILMSCLV